MPEEDSFRALGASDAVASALEQRDISSPFPIQRSVIPDAIRGEDILAKSPTGSGKTLAFAVPIVEDIAPDEARPTALVLVPTRELASQVAEQFEVVAKPRGLRVGLAYGGVAIAPQAKRAKRRPHPRRHTGAAHRSSRAQADHAQAHSHTRAR